jgi:hypothetical protein
MFEVRNLKQETKRTLILNFALDAPIDDGLNAMKAS